MQVLPGLRRAAGAAESCRVLRGGSFNNNERNARAAYRNRNNPNNHNWNSGFRVCVAAHFSHRARAARRKCRPAMARRPRHREKARPAPGRSRVRWARLGQIWNSPGPWVYAPGPGRFSATRARQDEQPGTSLRTWHDVLAHDHRPSP